MHFFVGYRGPYRPIGRICNANVALPLACPATEALGWSGEFLIILVIFLNPAINIKHFEIWFFFSQLKGKITLALVLDTLPTMGNKANIVTTAVCCWCIGKGIKRQTVFISRSCLNGSWPNTPTNTHTPLTLELEAHPCEVGITTGTTTNRTSTHRERNLLPYYYSMNYANLGAFFRPIVCAASSHVPGELWGCVCVSVCKCIN